MTMQLHEQYAATQDALTFFYDAWVVTLDASGENPAADRMAAAAMTTHFAAVNRARKATHARRARGRG